MYIIVECDTAKNDGIVLATADTETDAKKIIARYRENFSVAMAELERKRGRTPQIDVKSGDLFADIYSHNSCTDISVFAVKTDKAAPPAGTAEAAPLEELFG